MISLVVIGVGAALLALNLLLGGKLNVALPLVFLMLGGAFSMAVSAGSPHWRWAPLLYIPGNLLLAFGLIFLINVLTQDWSAWAYAWLLLAAGVGAGMVQAGRQQDWPAWVVPTGWGVMLGSVTLFALFGAIAGGLFIQVMAPILVILGGLALRWLPPEKILPAVLRKRLPFAARAEAPASQPHALPDQTALAEPLSTRELEVLQLVHQGLSNQQIALRLNVAPSTVKTHINNIYGKLGVQTRVQAITRARELGLLDS